jgi:tRNA1(Val) A37 N6-methylase TrmN6
VHERTRRHLQTIAHTTGTNPAPGIEQRPAPRSVWLTGQVCSRDQRRHRYLYASLAHPGKMLPSIARYLIATYTHPGDLVLDPMCGIGTTPVEAIHLARNAVGVEYEHRWAGLAEANLAHARDHGAIGQAQIVRGDARQLPHLLPDELLGTVALVVTSPPYGPSTHGHVREYAGRGGRVSKVNHRYGHDRANLAHSSHHQLATGFATILTGCVPLLQPGGVVAVTARPYRTRGELVDIPGMVAAAGHAAGLTLVDRCVALIAGIRDGKLVPRASFFQLHNIRLAHQNGDPQWLLQHELVHIFQATRTRHQSARNWSDPAVAPADYGLDGSTLSRVDRCRHQARPANAEPGSAAESWPHQGRAIERTADPCPPYPHPMLGFEQSPATGDRRPAGRATPPPTTWSDMAGWQ